MDRSDSVIYVPPLPPRAARFSHSSDGPKGEELARMQSLWNTAARILHSENRLWAQHRFEDFRGGRISPIDVARASDAGLAEALFYLEHSRERLLDWGWTGGPNPPWRTRPKRRKPASWTWTKRPPPP